MHNYPIDIPFLKDILYTIKKDKEIRYADIRLSNTIYENISTKNKEINNISNKNIKGIGIRVLTKNAWGFASSNLFEKDIIYKTAKQAIEIAKINSKLFNKTIEIETLPPLKDNYKSPYKQDPFLIDIKDKINFLLHINEKALKEKLVKLITSNLTFIKENRFFINTEDRIINQDFIKSGAGYSIFVSDGKDLQKRSYPAQFGGDFAQAGFEFIKELKLYENLDRVIDEAKQLLKAKECPFKKMDLILKGDQLALQVHESAGHPSELDRVFLTEESFAGSSFLTIDKLNKFKYGSDIVNIYIDTNIEGALGTRKYDDEGVKTTKRDYIIKEGILTGYLTSRDTANRINRKSNGSAVAQSALDYPIIRMTNVNLQPGNVSFEDMISDTKEGILLDTNKSWSIDDKRLNFQFGTEIGYLIKNGKIVDICKNPIYSGLTPEFWSSCDAIADEKLWHVWGIPNCGKGEPVQTAQVGHGVSAARFKNVQVGVKK